MKNVLLLATFALLTSTTVATAACTCRCVDGEMQSVCERAVDIPPVCHPVVCRIVPPSIAPIVTPTAPPAGTSRCRQRQVCDRFGNCDWQQVCRSLHDDGFVEDP